MEVSGPQHAHKPAGTGQDVVMIDSPGPSQPRPEPRQTASSVPPPSSRESSLPQMEQRSRLSPALNGTVSYSPSTTHAAPRSGHQSPSNSTGSFASPSERKDLQGADQYTQLANMIRTSDPAIVRQVLRDHWQQCFVGSEYHTAFALNATLHQATERTLARAAEDFGQRLVATAKGQLLSHFQQSDFDEVADVILKKVSTRFLDRALAQRVETIEARSLVNVLASAERLGFSVDDIVEEHPRTNGSGKTESVIPSLEGLPLQQLSQPPQQQPREEVPGPDAGTGIIECGACKRPCSGVEALTYHSKKAACNPDFRYEDVGKSICPHCGCLFGSSGGVNYHLKSEVCGAYSEATTKTIYQRLESYVQNRGQRRTQNRNKGWAQQARAPASAVASPMATSGYQQTGQPQLVYTPLRTQQSSPHPSSANQPPRDDPYEHLSAETLAKFRWEINQAEETYGKKMRDAMLLPEPESTDKLSRLKNAYNAKVSTTRKRHGIRLKERRSKEEVDAERIRLLGRADAPELWLEQERRARDLERLAKRPRDTANWSGMPPTDTPSHSTKPPQVPPVESPRKRVPLSEMGGLTGSAASAEVVDPTAHQAPSSQPRGFAQVQQQQPAPETNRPQGTPGNPMAVDDDSDDSIHSGKASGLGTDSSEEDSDSDSDSDIPAV